MFEFFKKKRSDNIVDDSIINSNNYQPHFKIDLKEYQEKVSSLTESEYKVYNEIVQGYSTEETSKRTKLKVNTIKSYQKSIYKKLGVHSKVELITTYANVYNYINDVNTNQTINDLKN